MKNLLYILIIIVLFGCESEEQKKQKAKEVVQELISNIQIDNYESVFKYYPTFRNLKGKYWKHKILDITSTILKDDGTVEIFATSNNDDQLFFLLKKMDDTYMVVKSKGISSYSNSNIYKYCKNIGCIGITESDIEMSRICNNKEDEFKRIVSSIKYEIEEKTRLESHALEIKKGGFGNYYAFGNITIKNYSRFTIPAYSYKIYVNYLDINDNVLFTSENFSDNYSDIGFNQSKTQHVMQDISSKFRKVDISLKLLNTEFIDKLIAEYAEGGSCIYSDNL
ncbi:hypothetical protein L3X39_02145 [Sabulilitoribacter multivorans]|uniref:Lipoprotein n=1 Tax=Flaviramulus multivorans TaxID=1304750 RepID=A0ABS9IF61_9FLAO|nr:hypothetical protein [Flaviramulus multivorans]MCF7559422.1 hypothetical protein [Flaviramulus multivorans]